MNTNNKQDSIVETQTTVVLSDEAVSKVVAGEMAKMLMTNEKLLVRLVQSVLDYRPPKIYNYNPKNPTFFESTLKEAFKPIIVRLVKEEAEKREPQLREAIKEAFGSKVDFEGFTKKIIKALADFTSNVSFYVSKP